MIESSEFMVQWLIVAGGLLTPAALIMLLAVWSEW